MITDWMLDTLNWTLMVISFSVLWYIMRDISKRLGEALQMRCYYRLYDLALALQLASYSAGFIAFTLELSYYVSGIDVLYVATRLVNLTSVIILVLVTVRYWGWIVPEVLALRKK